ncbi:DUF885 domain-containing protein [Flagellimonas sp. HMM57]|uniref:DUF885 domain-containing protein n=1 Tax=unclassified Flagellimonas TaxID=2644544 RepID=UPI0013D6A49D|nr:MULTISPECIES: DUF885 domain-containing protein [unclassified Flagellimonas]UII75083.1 DUF885 domain-containing protein [Flagellimonas sp. HMM57]
MTKKITLLCAILVSLFSCKQEPKQENTPDLSANFSKILDNYYEDGLKLNPINATMAGDHRYDDVFVNLLSDEYLERIKTHYSTYKNELGTFSDEDLSDSEKMSKAILTWECNIHLEELKFNANLTPIDQMWSPNLFMGQLASGSSAQPFNTVEDYEKWMKRVDGYLEWMNSAEERMREGMEKGHVLPTSLIKKVLPQLQSLTDRNLDEHLFYGPIKNFPDDFTEEEKSTLEEAFTRMILDKIVPSYERLYTFMSEEYIKRGRESSGIQGEPDGDAYYAHQIKKYTTTNMTATEIHELGLSEVARIRAEMEKIKTTVGFEGDLKAFFDFVRSNEELMPFKEPNEVIDNFNAIHNRMKPQIEKLFDVKPKTAFAVKRTEAFREKSASAEYNPGSLDGTRPGIFYVPIPDVTAYNTYSDESLFLHEAIPGHHYQISLTQESEVLPKFRKTLWYSGYGEGWALYSESLGTELGLYTDPYQLFGMLGAEMHRAVRLVVDTGLHSKGWTREEAIQYSLDNEAESEASITSEIERYMANPGQALSYKIGQLKIRELREKAEKALGENFDIRKFHNQVLETGCVPLALLEEKINNWIKANS